MLFETSVKNGYTILRVNEDLTGGSDLTELKGAVRRLLDEGMTHLALCFTQETYFCSVTLSVLVQFLGFVKERDGELAIIKPNEKILNTLTIVGLTKLIRTYPSEDSLQMQDTLAP